MPETPSAFSAPPSESLERHSCQSCTWSGGAPVAMTASEHSAVLSGLAPGERVPSGRCPQCRGLTVPGPIAETQLSPDPADPDDGAVLPWTARIDRIGDLLVLQLQHPDGHGVECAVDIQGGKPTFHLLPWDDPVGLEDADPIATIKAGSDHVSFRHARQEISRAVVCTPNVLQASLPLSREQWNELVHWCDAPDMVGAPGTPARSAR